MGRDVNRCTSLICLPRWDPLRNDVALQPALVLPFLLLRCSTRPTWWHDQARCRRSDPALAVEVEGSAWHGNGARAFYAAPSGSSGQSDAPRPAPGFHGAGLRF